MMQAISGVACMVALLGCAADLPDLLAKACPCVDGLTCKLELNQCIKAETGTTESLGCVIYTDGKLYCHNKLGTEMYAQPAASGAVINHLQTTYSWFICWTPGQLHPDGTTTWYFTDGDDHAAPYGWLSAGDVQAPQEFNADPSAYGFKRCASP